MSSFKYKFQMYKHLQANTQKIYAEAREVAEDLGIGDLKGKIGLTGAISGCPAPMRRNVLEAIEKGEKQVVPLAKIVDEIRDRQRRYDSMMPCKHLRGGLWVTFTACSHLPIGTRRQVRSGTLSPGKSTCITREATAVHSQPNSKSFWLTVDQLQATWDSQESVWITSM